jgi:hypothetical protein
MCGGKEREAERERERERERGRERGGGREKGGNSYRRWKDIDESQFDQGTLTKG